MRHESLFYLFSAITRIKGIGGATAQALGRLLPAATALSGAQIPIIRDLLFHLPIGLVDRRFTCPLVNAPDDTIATFVVRVDSHHPPSAASRYGGRKPYKVICSNDTGTLTLVFFHASNDYIKQTLPVGATRVVSGRTEHFDGRLQMTPPDMVAPVDQLAEVQKPEAVYPLTLGLTSRRIATLVGAALEKLPDLPEWITPDYVAEQAWPSWKQALAAAHHLDTEAALQPDAPARMRLAYDEIFANQLHLAILRHNRQRQPGETITGTGALTEKLLAALPFQLTAGQRAVGEEIAADMRSGHRMGRLLQGDVGSGKTVVALLAMLRACEHGLQAALMVPTEIIAQQHFETISKLVALISSPLEGEGRVGGLLFNVSMLQPTPLPVPRALKEQCSFETARPQGEGEINVTLLTGSVKGKQRETVLADIASGRAGIIIGTHALFQEQVTFANLALVVIDEQHRFGVNQRMALTAKGNAPHLLHMTATPIPRSLAMTLYGDMDISSLHEKPAGRQPIATRIIPLSRYDSIMERLAAALARGEKAYWICPLIEGKEGVDTAEEDLAAAQTRFTEFKARFGDVVGLVHGRMKSEARDAEMHRFARGDTRLLVATTVVEVGVDVKDATIIVIERAERFGLSQLHQLRGRVGRGDKPSACVLLASDRAGEVAAARLAILRESEDGFRIAETDLAIRGGGDLLGVRQSGLPRFIFTDPLRHQALLEHARSDARALLAADPGLSSERGNACTLLLQLFGYNIAD